MATKITIWIVEMINSFLQCNYQFWLQRSSNQLCERMKAHSTALGACRLSRHGEIDKQNFKVVLN